MTTRVAIKLFISSGNLNEVVAQSPRLAVLGLPGVIIKKSFNLEEVVAKHDLPN